MCKNAFDAKNCGRSVQIGFLRKVISQKSEKKHAEAKLKENLNYINGGTQERKFRFIKISFHIHINGGTQD